MSTVGPQVERRFRLKLVPLLVVAALGWGVPIAGAFLALFSSKVIGTPSPQGPNLQWLYAQHTCQLLVAFIIIAALKYKFMPADYGLHWPRGKTHILPALLWGVFFGVLMTAVDYAPQLLQHTRPAMDNPLTSSNIWGWLFFEGVYVGPTEEIPFRALLVTYLAAAMPGRVHLGRYNMNWAGVIVAVIFALLHANNFDTRHWAEALGQQIYAFALGVLYAYWLEKSRSVFASTIGHNIGDIAEYLIVFAWVGAF